MNVYLKSIATNEVLLFSIGRIITCGFCVSNIMQFFCDLCVGMDVNRILISILIVFFRTLYVTIP